MNSRIKENLGWRTTLNFIQLKDFLKTSDIHLKGKTAIMPVGRVAGELLRFTSSSLQFIFSASLFSGGNAGHAYSFHNGW